MPNLSHLGFQFFRPFLHRMDAEEAHHLTLKTLQTGSAFLSPPPCPKGLATDVLGLKFSHPLGLAAGFDKNAEVPDPLLNLGFSFVEIGTITPHPQAGNPKPRLFRLNAAQAVINRMGFNNDGHQRVRARLEHRRHKGGIIGVNIGANKDSPDKMADYVAGLEAFADLASYFTLNISSPNTPGLRGLQSTEALSELLDRLNEARVKFLKPVPMLVKIAPDLEPHELEAIAAVCLRHQVEGVIISNTTITRPKAQSAEDQARLTEAGGLSGAPLFALSTRQLARFYLLTQGKIPLIAAGGISSAAQAWDKLEAGASLLQLYSALVYQGPALIGRILEGLETRRKQEGLHALNLLTGRAAQKWIT